MSILSEAWRRARGSDRRLAETLGAPTVGSRERPPVLPWLLCLLLAALAAGLGVIVWLNLSRAPAPVQPLPATSPRVGQVAPPPVSAFTGQAARRKIETSPPASKLPALEAQKSKKTHTASRGAVALSPPSASVPSRMPAAKTNEPQDAGHKQQAQAQAQAQAPRAAPQNTIAPPSTPMPLAAAPDAIRSSFPDIAVVAHVWNSDPASRFVVIGAKQFRAGDEIAPGVRLIKITRDGEQVAFRGYRLLLP
jgi:hypothetical protein